jgi:hypothetical protein
MSNLRIEDCLRLAAPAHAGVTNDLTDVRVSLQRDGDASLTLRLQLVRKPVGVIVSCAFWVCPSCRNHVRYLYLPLNESDLRCQRCWRLSYDSQRLASRGLRQRKEDRLWTAVTNPQLSWKAWFRAYQELVQLEAQGQVIADTCRTALKARMAMRPKRPYATRGRGRPSKRWHEENDHVRRYLEGLEYDPERDDLRERGAHPAGDIAAGPGQIVDQFHQAIHAMATSKAWARRVQAPRPSRAPKLPPIQRGMPTPRR